LHAHPGKNSSLKFLHYESAPKLDPLVELSEPGEIPVKKDHVTVYCPVKVFYINSLLLLHAPKYMPLFYSEI